MSYHHIVNSGNTYRFTSWFAGNGPYDPDTTGSATVQPTGWDQWSQFYDSYYCSGSKIKVEIIPESLIAGNAGIIAGVFPSKEIFQASDFTTAKPNDYAYVTEKMLNIQTGPGGRFVAKKYMATKKMFGFKTAYSPAMQGVTGNLGTGSNPSGLWYWNIYTYDPSQSAVDTIIPVRATITFYVQFFGRKDLPMS